MPAGNRRGPQGLGPLTGRGRGHCSGRNHPGYGSGGGFGRGGVRGCGFVGYHRGPFLGTDKGTAPSLADEVDQLRTHLESLAERLAELG